MTSASRGDAGAGAPARVATVCHDLEGLRVSNPYYDAVIDEVRGRRIRIGEKWLIDYASCNYLGLDLDPYVMDSIAEAVRRWGTHPSWSRLLGSPRIYVDLETRVAELLGAPDVLLLPTITHIHMSVIPALARGGSVIVSNQAHKTIYDGCANAQVTGASLFSFREGDLDQLHSLLTATAGGPQVVCVDGVNSMTGNSPDIRALANLCRTFGATLYVDDAHGFGIVGERGAAEPSPYGFRGNSIVRHQGEDYDNIVLVGGFSKSYSSLLAFIALPTALKNHLKTAAAPYLYSGPSPVASLATTQAGLDVNEERGDELRRVLYCSTQRVLQHLAVLGISTLNRSGTPIIEIPVGSDRLEAVSNYLWRSNIYVTLAAYPLVPRSQAGFRLQLTSAHTVEDVDELLLALTGLAEHL